MVKCPLVQHPTAMPPPYHRHFPSDPLPTSCRTRSCCFLQHKIYCHWAKKEACVPLCPSNSPTAATTFRPNRRFCSSITERFLTYAPVFCWVSVIPTLPARYRTAATYTLSAKSGFNSSPASSFITFRQNAPVSPQFPYGQMPSQNEWYYFVNI